MTKYDKYGALHVNKKGKLVDRNGETVTLHGCSTHGLSWYPQYINRDFFVFLRDKWHADIIRLAMYTAEYNGYCTGNEENKKKLIDLIDKGVRYATEVGLYVIIDWHILHDSNPLTYKDEAIAFFDLVAEKYKAYGNVFYEICNEPNKGCNWDDIKSYAQDIIPVIRKHDKYGVILVGTPEWSQNVDKAVADPITIDDNLMYVLHFYADTHRESLRAKFADAAGKNLPMFITEFGCCDAGGDLKNNFEEADEWIKLADKHDVGYIIWNISNRDESSASFIPECKKLTDFTEEDMNEAFIWYIEVLRQHADQKQ